MSSHTDKARQLMARGKYGSALDSLRYAAPVAQGGDLDLAREILELIDQIEAAGGRRVLGDCQELKDSIVASIAREAERKQAQAEGKPSEVVIPTLQPLPMPVPRPDSSAPQKGVVSCVSCGKKANAEWTVCPECGANPTTGRWEQEADTERVEFMRASYLGGLPWAERQLRGRLAFTRQSIDLAPSSLQPPIAMEEVKAIELMNSDQARARLQSPGAAVGAAVAAAVLLPALIGVPVLLGMAAGERINRLALAVYLIHQDSTLCAFFQVDDVYPNLFHDRLGPLLKSVGVALGTSPEAQAH